MSTRNQQQYEPGPWQAYKERRGEGRPSDAEWEATKLDARLAFKALLDDDRFWQNMSGYEPVFMAGYRAGMRRANQMMGGK